MIDLSPAAQVVKDAALALYADCVSRESAWAVDAEIIAAALRGAAVYCKHDRLHLLSIADELESLCE